MGPYMQKTVYKEITKILNKTTLNAALKLTTISTDSCKHEIKSPHTIME